MHPPHERPLIQRQDPGRSLGPDSRGARLPVENGHLAKDVAGLQLPHRNLSTIHVTHDFGPASLDHVHPIPRLSLAADHFSVGVFLTQRSRFHLQIPLLSCARPCRGQAHFPSQTVPRSGDPASG